MILGLQYATSIGACIRKRWTAGLKYRGYRLRQRRRRSLGNRPLQILVSQRRMIVSGSGDRLSCARAVGLAQSRSGQPKMTESALEKALIALYGVLLKSDDLRQKFVRATALSELHGRVASQKPQGSFRA